MNKSTSVVTGLKPLVDGPAFRAVYPFGKTRFFEDLKSGLIPPPVRLSRRKSLWRREDVERVLARLMSIE